MNKAIHSVFAASLSLAGLATAAQVNWTTSPGVLDSEVSTTGVQVFGYYWASAGGAPVVIVNSAAFALQQTTLAPAGLNFNGSYNNVEGVDLYQVPLTAGNGGLSQILDGQNWGGEASLIVTDLVPGAPYQVQYMISDDRVAFLNTRNYDVSDQFDPEGSRDIERAYHSTRGGGVPVGTPPGSVEAKIFTGTFTADASGTQEIYNVLYGGTDHFAANAGSQVNAIQVRLIPEPGTFALMGSALGLLALLRRRR